MAVVPPQYHFAMRNTIRLASIASLLILVSSCNKEKEEDPGPTPTTIADVSLLAVGNYWVYERVNLDSNGLVSSEVVGRIP